MNQPQGGIFNWEKFSLHPWTITKILFLILQLQDQITETIQLLKQDKFGPLHHFKGGFLFSKNIKV